MNPTFSGTRVAAGYFLAQGALIVGWWAWLSGDPDRVRPFLPDGAAPVDLLAFRYADLLLAVPLSVAAGVAILAGARWALPLAWAAAGAIDYAFFYCLGWSLLRGGGWWSVALMAPAALFGTVAALDASGSSLRIFRPARPAPRRRHVLATVAQIVLFWSFFLAVVPLAILFVEERLRPPLPGFAPMPSVAGVAFILCSALGLASGLAMARRGAGTPLPFDGTNRLVTDGCYARLRNPMVVAGLGQGLSVAVWFGSWSLVAYVVTGGLLWQILVRPAEERELERQFGEEFVRYRQRVRCWVPRVRGRRRAGMMVVPVMALTVLGCQSLVMLQARIVDGEGAPIEGATVTVSRDGYRAEAVTGPGGCIELFDSVAPGRRGFSVRVRAPGRRGVETRIRTSRTHRCDFVLAAESPAAGSEARCKAADDLNAWAAVCPDPVSMRGEGW